MRAKKGIPGRRISEAKAWKLGVGARSWCVPVVMNCRASDLNLV